MFSTIRQSMQLFGSFQDTQMLALGDEGEEFDLQVRVGRKCRARRGGMRRAERARHGAAGRKCVPGNGGRARRALSCPRAGPRAGGGARRAVRDLCELAEEGGRDCVWRHGPAGRHPASWFAAARACTRAAGSHIARPVSPSSRRRVKGAAGACPLRAGHSVISARVPAWSAPSPRPNARRTGLRRQVHGSARFIHRGCCGSEARHRPLQGLPRCLCGCQ